MKKVLSISGFTSKLTTAFGLLGSKHLVTSEYKVYCDDLPKSFSGFRILHLSDLHKTQFGEHNDKLIKACKKVRPDIIFFTGDLYSRVEKKFDEKITFMQKLNEIAPTYYTFGNHETETPKKAQNLVDKLDVIGIRTLVNQKEMLIKGDDLINIYGIDIGRKYYKNADGSYKNLPEFTSDDLKKLVGSSDSGFDILLAHSPFPFNAYAKWGADITFSGHCHGGIIRLPIVGGVLSPERKFFPKYTKGVYTNSKYDKISQMVVSAGLGKFRLFNPAEIVLVTLERND